MPERLLLRFKDRPQAISVLGAIGVEFDAVSGDGIIRKPTGETAEFEGEVIALTCPVSGYHVSLLWCGDLPCTLAPYVVAGSAPKADIAD
ncbi:hypothetical protein QTA58_06650 [Neorhizobium sp. CSC1952]|mgnify:CR=1 FL=1|uniref:hypothetical protein n=1 Tax=Neorhizobium TaxID=1525371 RepID=UPI0025A5F8F4|nr:hypothetical protein [Rhizobium sp. CSC1952]WJR68426.1 hypothetical protein QTA58_06650 [Rhizobium sp. CSC1952]